MPVWPKLELEPCTRPYHHNADDDNDEGEGMAMGARNALSGEQT
jgi:hypothetical protein